MAENLTVFQRLAQMMGANANYKQPKNTISYNLNIDPNTVIYKTDNKADRDLMELELKQQKMLSYQFTSFLYF